MEYQSKEIVDIITVDKREVDLKSPNLEVRGFCKLLRLLLDAGIQVKEVITDAHVQVTSAMSKLHCTSGLYNNPPTDTRIINFVRGLKIIIKLPDLQYSGIISTLTAAFFSPDFSLHAKYHKSVSLQEIVSLTKIQIYIMNQSLKIRFFFTGHQLDQVTTHFY